MTSRLIRCSVLMVAVSVLASGACAKKKPPVARPMAPAAVPAPAVDVVPMPPPAPAPLTVTEPPVAPPPRVIDDPLASRNIDDLNKETPLQPVFYDYDRAELTQAARTALDTNAGILRKYPTWVITVEGHCDERGTAEYNSALGERRAAAARAYLVSLGIAADRLHIVSYGKEFPFDPAHNEAAWARNRRAHFVITAK